ncbi:MAG: putative Ig domain-containing protein [Anaerolineae bacterium]
MKKRNSQLIKKWIWVLSALLILPTIALASPALRPANLVPAVTETVGTIPDQNKAVGDAVDLTITATDGITYTASPLPGGIGINPDGTFTGSFSTQQNMTTNVSVQNAAGAEIATDTFEWIIIAAAPPNNDPVLNSPGNQITTRFEPVNIQLQASDADLDTLTYSKVGAWPSGVNLNSSSGLISGSTNQIQAATDVTAKVSDGNGGEDTVTFQWTVKQGTVLGNEAVDVATDRVDGSIENMVINLSDWVRNDTNGSITVNVTQFTFHAENPNIPITPFLVKVAKDVPITNYDFTVVAIGTTRTTYEAGNVFFDFKNGGATVNLAPGETLLPGFMDAFANGNGGVVNDIGATVALDEKSNPDSIWYTYVSANTQDSHSGYSIQLNQAPNPVKYGNSAPQVLTNLKRNYRFNITLGVDSSLATPTPIALPTPEPTPDAPWQIKNGSFEADGAGEARRSISDWDVIDPDDNNNQNNGVDIKTGTDSNGDRLAIEGTQSLDLNSSAISQTVSGLTPGQPYILRVDYRVEKNEGEPRGFAGTVADASVFINGEEMGMGLYSTDVKGIHTNEDRDFIACNGFEFTPLTSTATIIFQSDETSSTTKNGILLDNVHLIEGKFPTPNEHNLADLDTLPGGWRELANGGFEQAVLPPTESLENTGAADNPHLCGAGLPGWRVTRESVDLIEAGDPVPPGSVLNDNIILDVGGHGPGGIGQTLTGLIPNEAYILRFYAARHFVYDEQGDMTSELWSNGVKVADIVRTNDQNYRDHGYLLELVEMTADDDGKITFELFSTVPEKSGNNVFDNFAIILASEAPALTQPFDQFNNVGDSVMLQMVSTDSEATPLTFSATGLPPTLEIDPDTGVISGTVDTADTYTVTVTATDAILVDVDVTFNWYVNTIPEISPIADRNSTDGNMVDFDVEATDDDGHDLEYSAEGLPTGVEIISTTGKITGTLSGYGMYTVTVTVNDNTGGEVSDSFVWDVNANPVLPELGDQVTNINVAVSLDASATDPNTADVLEYSATGLPTGLDIDSATGLISGTVTAVGNYTVTLTVDDGVDSDDGDGGSDAWTFNWVVNTPPVITTSPSDQMNNEGDIATVLVVSAEDADEDTITYSATNLPPGVSINPASGVISGTLTEGGTFVVTVMAEDGNGGSDSATFTWNVNSKPEVTNPGDQSTVVNGVVDLTVAATDADGDTLEFSATGLPTGLSIDSATGNISGTATVAGSYSVVVSAEDTNGLIGSAEFTWVVNTPPEFTTAPGDQTGSRGEEVSLTVVATDADGDTITYSATDLPDGLTIDPATGEISGELLSGGQWTSTITASDGNGGETSITIFWDIDGIVVPPTGLVKVFLPLVGR